jgi:hypothetical protein
MAFFLTLVGTLLAVAILLKGIRYPLDCRAGTVARCALFVGAVMMGSVMLDLWLFKQRLVGISHGN